MCFLEVSLGSSVTTHQLPGINPEQHHDSGWCIVDTEEDSREMFGGVSGLHLRTSRENHRGKIFLRKCFIN